MPTDSDIARLPPKERDILNLHMVLRKSQTETAQILRVSQPTVNYRYKRARERLAFMEKVPSVTPKEVREVLRTLGARDNDIEAMALYVQTSSQSEVARQMNTSQGAVRHWLLRALVVHLQNDMREDDKHKRVRTACRLLFDKPGIFNEPAKQQDDALKVVSQRLPTMPKVRGRAAVGERLQVLDGLYAKLEGEVVELEKDYMTVLIVLQSQKIRLTWPVGG